MTTAPLDVLLVCARQYIKHLMYIILLCSQSYEVGLLSLFLVMGRVRPGEFKQIAQYLKSRQSKTPKDTFLTITQDCTSHDSVLPHMKN